MRRGDRSQKLYGGFNDKKNLLQNDAMLTRGKNDTESLNHCRRKKKLESDPHKNGQVGPIKVFPCPYFMTRHQTCSVKADVLQ